MKVYKKRRPTELRHGYRNCLTCHKLLNWFYMYCENTSLHGYRYINIASTKLERRFWIAACASAFVFCVILMARLWRNYTINPITTTIDTSNPIWELPFPAVTICNNNKVYRPYADVIAENLHMNGFSMDESEKFFSSLMKLIRPDKISIDNVTASQVLDNLNMTVDTLMLKLMQPCSSLLVRCAWIGQIHDCSKMFRTVKSREGFCCAFNSRYKLNTDQNYTYEELEARDEFAELNVTSDDLPNVTETLKVPGSGRDLGLMVALNIEGDMYKATSRPYIGATVLINDPIDFPDIGAQTVAVAPGHVLAISVTGSSIKSLDNMRDILPERRKCFFDDEKRGDLPYSSQSCMSECIAKYTQNVCGCLPFYFPEKHDGIRTCYLPDLNCLLSIRKSLPNYAAACKKCLPQCSDMKYHINVENVKMDDVGYDSDITRGLNTQTVSFVYIYFGDITYEEYVKESNLSWDSLLASFGGIYGLCLGGSVLSVIEFGYLIARQFFRKRLCRRSKDQLFANLPPASEIFLSIPVEEIQRPRDQQEVNDNRFFVTWQQPTTLQRRRTIMKLDDVRRKRGKF